ncbi:TetR/AcrR family transcriptional regulator [Rugamonas sp.]|uniref:TetR/AcrR family transcriptional regulator n=1 Tax=Rugamonas sp. TaxID=1926287 RepID=UPI0025DDC09A|nr:TetR/AcrR family transcriptional regulator [Rugamonas sp.]
MLKIKRKAGRPLAATLGQRREDLLSAALDLFVEHGYADVSMAMVAKTAHVAIRTIYIQFGAKDALLRAIVEADAVSHRQQLEKLELDGLPFAARLEKLALHLWRRCSDNRVRKLQAIVFSHPDRTLSDAWRRANPEQMATLLQKELAAAPMQFMQDLTPELLWEHFLSCIAGNPAIVGWTPEPEPEERVRRGLTLFIRAVSR